MRFKYILWTACIIPGLLLSQYTDWENYTNGDEVTSIAQEGGFLWIGTTGGLVKLDTTSRTAQHFNKSNSGLPMLDITAVQVDSFGNKWIGTNGGGLVKYDDVTWTVYDTSNSTFPSNRIYCIELNTENQPLVGTDSGFSVFDGTTWIVFTSGNSNLPNDRVWAIAYSSITDVAWFGTEGGLWATDESAIDVVYTDANGLPNNFITAVALDTLGNPWVGTQYSGVAYYTPGIGWENYDTGNSGISSNQIEDIIVNSINNDPYVCTGDSGISRYNSQILNWIIYDTTTSDIPSNHINLIYPVDLLTGWVGTMDAGLVKVRNNIWDTNYNTSQSGIASNNVELLAGTETAGEMWVASYDDFSGQPALSFFNGFDWQIYTPSNSPLPTNGIRDMRVIDGDLYFATLGSGAWTFDGFTTWSNLNIPDNNCMCAVVDNDSVIWVGTYSGLRYYDDGTWRVYSTDTGLPNNFIVAVAATDSNNIWAGSEWGDSPELYHYNGTAWTTYDTTDGLPDGFIQDIALDQSGFPFIGMNTGISFFDGTSFHNKTTANSILPGNNVHDIYVESDGTVWISTQSGVLWRSDTDSTTYQISNSGLPSDDVWAVRKDAGGDFWFATDGGLAKFNAGPTLEPALTINPSTLNFGTELVGSSTNLSATLTNSGDANLAMFFPILKMGPDTASFDYSLSYPDPWTPGLSTNLNVTFHPFTEGAKQASLVIFSNAPSSPDTLTLLGTAQLPVPEFSADKDTLAFGEVSVGVPKPDTLIVTNSGTDTLSLENPELFGADTSRFTITSGGGAVDLLPGQSRQLILTFTPSGVQDYAASLVFFSNAASSPDTIPLSGSGIFAFPELTVSTTTLDFGAMNINVSATVQVRLESTGLLAVENISVSLTQPVANIFSVASIPTTLESGATTNLNVTFTPRAAITYAGLIVITSNAPSSPDSITITGTGRMVALSLEPHDLDFGAVQVDSSVTRSFWMKNNSYSAIQIIRSYIRPLLDNAVYSVVGDMPHQLPALDSIQITLQYTPKANATDSAAFIIESSANSSPDSVYITGTGQAFNFNFTTPPAPPAGQGDYSLTFTVDPPVPGIAVRVHYIQAGKTNWHSIACNYKKEDHTYSAVLPDSILNLRGLVYYMSVEDSTTGATIYQNGSPDSPAAFIPVTVEEQESPVAPEEETYTLISVPCNLEDERIMEVLRDDLGPQTAKSWRLFYWDPVDSVYNEFDPVRDVLTWTFTPGKAYWLITRNGSRLTIENGESTNGLNPFSITLQSGWNQIGNPFAFRVRWSDVSNTSLLQLVGRTGNSYTYNNTVLEPWTGYFAYNPSTVQRTILIPPVEAPATPKSPGEMIGEGDFTIQIRAQGLDSDYLDDQNFVGMKASAENGRDASDFFEAPPIGDPVSLSIVDGKINYAGNFRQTSENGACWDLALQVTGRAESVRLSLDWTGQAAEGFETWLLDRDRECLIPLRDNVAEIPVTGNNAVKSLRLIVGTESYAGNVNEGIPLVPYAFALMQNYPNPFNPETQIQYNLREKTSVSLAIYNIGGQRIRTLAQGVETTGPHHVTWDGRNDRGISVPSGIYIFRLETPAYTASKKMILVR